MKFFNVYRQPIQTHVYKRINVKTVEDGVDASIWWNLTWMCNEKGTTSKAWSKTRSFL